MAKPRPIAPQDLRLPDHVASQLGRRQDRILNHGFPAASIGPGWWHARVPAAQAVTLADHGGGLLLTRGDLFEMGRAASRPGATDDDVCTLLWNTLAWGTGKNQRGNTSRIRSLTNAPEGEGRIHILRTAAQAAAAGNPRLAYSTLIRRGGGVIPGLGPAFFTKFLYFASEDAPASESAAGTRCLILDARVASSLAAAGWTSLPHRGSSYSANWYTDTYVSYCDLLARCAREQSQHLGVKVFPDEIERALFEGPTDHTES